MNVERIIRRVKQSISYRHPHTYKEELNYQCRLFVIPTVFMTLFGFLPFIPLDIALHPDIPLIVYLRWGLTVTGLIVAIIHYVPIFDKMHPYFRKHKSYLLILFAIGYAEIASAIILALVKGEPAYLGGYCIILLLLPLTPLKIIHSFILLAVSCAIFFFFGIINGMVFDSPDKMYGLINFIIAILLVVIVVSAFGLLRKHSYSNNLLIQNRTDNKIEKFFNSKSISKREGEILRLVISGNSNKDIEKKLFISLTTVKSHLYNAYQKLGVKTRVQLIHLIQDIKKEW